MTQAWQHRSLSFRTSPRASALALMLVIAFILSVAVAPTAQAQTFSVLHSFGNNGDGYEPLAGLAIDAGGNLYGTTFFGGASNQCSDCGTVFKLARRNSGWIYSTILSFNGGDGDHPAAQLVFGHDGSLYGTTTAGGSFDNGNVFNLRPQPRACVTALCPWEATVLHSFDGGDGSYPTNIAFDQAGNLYGTAWDGGTEDLGSIYELTPSGGSWTFQVLYDFSAFGVSNPNGVIPDQNGNLYGTTSQTPGAAFELTSSGQFQVLFTFNSGSGVDPDTGLIFDSSGNLYGQTLYEGPDGYGGTVFELSPSGGGWSFSLLHSFSGKNNGVVGSPNLVIDAQGNLYGTTAWNGAHAYGEVFKLTPSSNGWIYTDLYDFTGGNDGCYPWSNVVMDSSGNLYGTASRCGTYGYGTVWEIMP